MMYVSQPRFNIFTPHWSGKSGDMKGKQINLPSDTGNATKFGYVKILNFHWGKK